MNEDAVARAGEALRTVIGSQETELRERLGDDGYSRFMQRSNALEDLAILDKSHHAEHSKQSAAFLAAKAGYWRSLSAAVPVVVLLGAGWSIWEWVR